MTKSETEAERLRAHARRSLELARAIADQEASRALKAYAAELLERARWLFARHEDLKARVDGPRGRRSLGVWDRDGKSAKLNPQVVSEELKGKSPSVRARKTGSNSSAPLRRQPPRLASLNRSSTRRFAQV